MFTSPHPTCWTAQMAREFPHAIEATPQGVAVGLYLQSGGSAPSLTRSHFLSGHTGEVSHAKMFSLTLNALLLGARSDNEVFQGIPLATRQVEKVFSPQFLAKELSQGGPKDDADILQPLNIEFLPHLNIGQIIEGEIPFRLHRTGLRVKALSENAVCSVSQDIDFSSWGVTSPKFGIHFFIGEGDREPIDLGPHHDINGMGLKLYHLLGFSGEPLATIEDWQDSPFPTRIFKNPPGVTSSFGHEADISINYHSGGGKPPLGDVEINIRGTDARPGLEGAEEELWTASESLRAAMVS